MRILLVTHHYLPELGAPQYRWDALAGQFIAAGHEVAVLAPPPHFPSGKAGQLPPRHAPGAIERGRNGEMIHRVRFREYGTGVRARGLDQAISALDSTRLGMARFRGRHRPDLVIATAPALPSIAAGLALGGALRVPVILEVRDAWPDLLRAKDEWDPGARPLAPDMRLLGPLGSPVRAVITALQRRADAVVTTTQAFADVLQTRGMQRVRVIRNGAHLIHHPPLPPVERTDGELRVLYLGTIGRAQGLANAVRAVARLRDNGVPVRMRIVGDGAESERIRALAEELNAPVDVVGPVPHERVMAEYGWADTILVTLRPWEPLRWTVPSKLYEALGTGRHITGVLDGEAAEILQRSGGGDVAPPGDTDALAHLWAGLQRRRSRLYVGNAGRAWVLRNATNENLAKTYLSLLEEVLHG